MLITLAFLLLSRRTLRWIKKFLFVNSVKPLLALVGEATVPMGVNQKEARSAK